MIVTITLNPSIDKSISVESLIPDAKLRCLAMKEEAGGGGINVAKALHKLDSEYMAICTSGGSTGNLLQDILRRDNISHRTISTSINTRENLMLFETSTNKQYRLLLPTQDKLSDITKELEAVMVKLKPKPSFIIASGSLPVGAAKNLYAEIGQIASRVSAKFIVDTSGDALKEALSNKVYLIKPSLAELSYLIGEEHLELDMVVDAAKDVISSHSCEVVVVSLGPAGAYIVSNDLIHLIQAPIVKKVSTVGAGDSMVAGIVFSLQNKKSLIEAVRFGVACGTAAVMSPGTELFNKDDASRLYEWMGKQNKEIKDILI